MIKSNAYFEISTESEAHLGAIIDIWKKYRSTLGLFPEGAFEEHKDKGWIICLLRDQCIAGYLLYRIAKGRAVIVHLCIDEPYRGKGGSQVLFDALRERVEDGLCRGVEVKCRGDYEVAPIWPKLGFEFITVGSGRGKQSVELIKWFFHFDTEDFFYDMLPKPEGDGLVWAILDANIVFKLGDSTRPENQEACALLADPVQLYVHYSVTPEIFSEIERKKDLSIKQQSRKMAKDFHRVDVRRSLLEKYQSALSPLWQGLQKARDRSDMKHVAYAAAAGIHVFITMDTGLLDKADRIFELVGVNIMRPVEFISQLDQFENESRYKPISISRSEFVIRTPQTDEISAIAQTFTNVGAGEKKKVFEAKLRTALAEVSTHDVQVTTDSNDEYITLIVVSGDATSCDISLIRHNGSSLAEALLQNRIWRMLAKNLENTEIMLKISDAFLPEETSRLFRQRGFFIEDNCLIRLALRGVMTKSDLITRLSRMEGPFSDALSTIIQHLSEGESFPVEQMEEAFWPLKITGFGVRSFVVPIKPSWAQHLFDEGLAAETLFGGDPSRFFNWENVYYCSPKATRLKAGARILWYVSSGKDKQSQVSQIRACSRVIDCEIDTAKSLFKRFSRLGIYQWRDMMQATKNDPHGKLMAIRFYQTECFDAPIPLACFKEHGLKSAPMSVTKISHTQFESIYRKGMVFNVR